MKYVLAIFVVAVLMLSGCATKDNDATVPLGDDSKIDAGGERMVNPALQPEIHEVQKGEGDVLKDEDFTEPEFSTQDLAAHASIEDCWVVRDGRVYDITPILSAYDGGVGEIASSCGLNDDFQNRFMNSHSGSNIESLMLEAPQIGNFLG